MRKMITNKISIFGTISLVFMVCSGFATATAVWTNEGNTYTPPNRWDDLSNWDPGIPLSTEEVWINQFVNEVAEGPIITSEIPEPTCVASHVQVGRTGYGHLTIEGGLLTCMSVRGAMYTGSTSNIHMSGGTIDAEQLYIGVKGLCMMDMTGGLVTLTDLLLLGQTSGGGVLNLDGGTIMADRLVFGSGSATVNITDGKLVFYGDQVSVMRGYVSTGIIKPGEPYTDILVYYDGDNTVLTAGFLLDSDINEDGYVNLQDFAIMSSEWLECTVESDPSCSVAD
jgi:hypothetical protein